MKPLASFARLVRRSISFFAAVVFPPIAAAIAAVQMNLIQVHPHIIPWMLASLLASAAGVLTLLKRHRPARSLATAAASVFFVIAAAKRPPTPDVAVHAQEHAEEAGDSETQVAVQPTPSPPPAPSVGKPAPSPHVAEEQPRTTPAPLASEPIPTPKPLVIVRRTVSEPEPTPAPQEEWVAVRRRPSR